MDKNLYQKLPRFSVENRNGVEIGDQMKKLFALAFILSLNFFVAAHTNPDEVKSLPHSDFSTLEFDFEFDLFGEAFLRGLADDVWRMIGLKSYSFVAAETFLSNPSLRLEIGIAYLALEHVKRCEGPIDCVSKLVPKFNELSKSEDALTLMSYSRAFKDVFAVISRLKSYERKAIIASLKNRKPMFDAKDANGKFSEDELDSLASCF